MKMVALVLAGGEGTRLYPLTAERFNLWNRRWPIRGEYDAALLAKIRAWRAEAQAAPAESASPANAVAAWRGAGRDLRTDERLQPS